MISNWDAYSESQWFQLNQELGKEVCQNINDDHGHGDTIVRGLLGNQNQTYGK